MDSDPNIIAQMEPIILPVLQGLLSSEDEAFEYLDHILDMLSYLTQSAYPITAEAWLFCGQLIHIANEWAFDYLSEVLAPLSNFITKVSCHETNDNMCVIYVCMRCWEKERKRKRV